MKIKYKIKKLPLIGPVARAINYAITSVRDSFSKSSEYWDGRYKSGKNSGPGSYGVLARFKAKVINSFVHEKEIHSVIEFGCGDGNQLTLASYPKYIGIDVSPTAIQICRERFSDDETKSFMTLQEYNGEKADLALSLDVIYHLLEDDVFEHHLRVLFDAARRYVIIYSSNTDMQEPFQPKHVRHRRFSEWIEHNITGWRLIHHIPNEHPYNGDDSEGSLADFFIYARSK